MQSAHQGWGNSKIQLSRQLVNQSLTSKLECIEEDYLWFLLTESILTSVPLYHDVKAHRKERGKKRTIYPYSKRYKRG